MENLPRSITISGHSTLSWFGVEEGKTQLKKVCGEMENWH